MPAERRRSEITDTLGAGGEDADPVGRQQPLVAGGDHEVAAVAGHGRHAEGMRCVHGQPGAAGARQLGAAREIEPLAREIAHVAHEEQPRARVHGLRQRVHREVMAHGPDDARLHPALAQRRDRIDQRRVLEVGEHRIVPGAPGHRAGGLVEPLGGMGEEGHPGRRDAQQPRHALLGPAVHREDLLAARHAAALERAEAPAGRIVGPEPRRLAARAEMRHALEPDELRLRDKAHERDSSTGAGGTASGEAPLARARQSRSDRKQMLSARSTRKASASRGT